MMCEEELQRKISIGIVRNKEERYYRRDVCFYIS